MAVCYRTYTYFCGLSKTKFLQVAATITANPVTEIPGIPSIGEIKFYNFSEMLDMFHCTSGARETSCEATFDQFFFNTSERDVVLWECTS